MVISTPNTYNGGYNTRYRAHVYEWNYEELKKSLDQIGFKIQHAFGIAADPERDFERELQEKYGQGALEYYQDIKHYMSPLFLASFMAVPLPKISKEIFFLLSKWERYSVVKIFG